MTAPTSLPLYEQELDPAGLAALLTDLELVAEIQAVRVRRAPGRHAEAGALDGDLRASAAALAAGRLDGLQVVYRHQGQLWCDTLMRGARGVRVVRVRLPDEAPGEASRS